MSAQNDYVKQFMEGGISLFFIISKGKEVESIDFKDIVQRKVDDDRVAILCWNSENQAEDFLFNALHGNQQLKVVVMNKYQLRDFIDRIQVDRKNILLEPMIPPNVNP